MHAFASGLDTRQLSFTATLALEYEHYDAPRTPLLG